MVRSTFDLIAVFIQRKFNQALGDNIRLICIHARHCLPSKLFLLGHTCICGTNSLDPDQTAPEEQSDWDLHCLLFCLQLIAKDTVWSVLFRLWNNHWF